MSTLAVIPVMFGTVKSFGRLSILNNTCIVLRSSIADALANCEPVWKLKKTATLEAYTLADHVI